MEVFMNRNFAKISVVIVALVLALAFCLTGCKVDDVAADLGTTKDEVSANKADAAKALEEAVKALEAKIAANEADCAAEIAAVNAALEEAKTSGAVTVADLEAAEKALNDAIAAVRASLDAAKKDLSDKITANDAKINAEVAALNTAIANAEVALKAAAAADKAALESSLAAAKAELDAAVAMLKADMTKLTEFVNSAVADLKADIAAEKKDITDSIVALENALILARGEAADADAAVKAELEQAIAEATKAIVDVLEIADAELEAELREAIEGLAESITALEEALGIYEATTEKVITVWNEIFEIYGEWNALCADHNVDAAVKAPVDKEYQLVQVLLGRAVNAEEVDAIKADFIAVVAQAQTEVPALKNLNEIYATLVSVEEELANDETDLVAVRTALLGVKAELATVALDVIIVDGVVVDLSDKYDAACDVYNAERVAEVYALIDSVANEIIAVDNYNAIWDAQAKAFDVEPVIDALVADAEIAVDVEDTNALYDAYNSLCALVPNQLLDIAVNVYLASGDIKYAEYCLEDAVYEIGYLPAETEGLAELQAKAVEVEAAIASAYIELALVAVETATDIETLKNAIAGIDANLAEAKADIFAMANGEAKDAVVAQYIAAQQAKLAKMEAVAYVALDAAATLKDVEVVESYKGEIGMAILAVMMDEVGVNTDDFGMTYSNLSMAAAEKVLAFAAAALENAENADAVVAVAETLAAAKAKIDVLAADAVLAADKVSAERIAAMVAKYEQYAGLVALVEEGKAIANIIAGLEADAIVGTKTESETITAYNVAAKAWVETLDKLYTFETKTGYETLRALINEAKAEEVIAAFEAKIANLVEIATDLINKIKAINAKVTEDGYTFALITDIEAVKAAFRTWEQNATDADGVGFIIAYVSDGEYTNENLNTVIVTIQTEYNAFVKGAQDAWTNCYTDYYKSLTVENLVWTETALTAVREWFTKYGTEAADYEITGVGTSVEEAALVVLEEKLAVLKAERKALVEKFAADAAALQERIEALGFITTDSAEAVEALRADVDAWNKAVVDNAIDFVAEFDKAVVIDETKLVEAEAKLVDLEGQIANIKDLIEALEIPTIGADIAAPYFADVAAKDAYVAQVKAITDAIAKFNTDNDGNRGCISDEELAKVVEADSELFVAKYEAALNAYNTYATAIAGVANDTVLAQLEAYLVAVRNEIDAVGVARATYTETMAAILAPYAAKVEATVEVYNEYVAACNGIANDTVLAKFEAFLKEAVAAIAGAEVEGINAIVELYTLKFETVVVVYNAYAETINGVSDEEVLAIMETYFNEALREISTANLNTTNYKAYIAQIGKNAEGKFNDIKEGNGLPVCQEHTYDNNCDPVCNVCFYTRTPADHVYVNECDKTCDECGATRVAPHLDANEDYKCDLCETKMLPAAGTALTIKQAITISKLYGHNAYTSQKYYITGYIVSVVNTTYGNMTIRDENGDEIYIYGLYSADGKTQYNRLPYKPVKGDQITIHTVIGTYSSSAQAKSAWLDEVVKHTEHVWIDATCTAPKTCKYCGATEGTKADHTYEEGVCTGCGRLENAVCLQNATISFNSTSNRTVFTTSQQVWEQNGIKLINDKSSSSSNIGNYSNPVRLYQGSKVTIEGVGMTKVVITASGESKHKTAVYDSVKNLAGATVTKSGDVITIVFAEAVDSFNFNMSAQGRISSITVNP